jgi:histone H3/H4
VDLDQSFSQYIVYQIVGCSLDFVYNVCFRFVRCSIMEFSTSKMKEMIKNEGDKRVSEESAEELGRVIEMFAGDVAEEATAIAGDNDRKTVRAEDVREALR